MLAYQGEAEAAGAMIVLAHPDLCRDGRAPTVSSWRPAATSPTPSAADTLVNAAGLYAPALARAIEGIPRETIPPAYFCRGVYFTLSGQDAVSPARLSGAAGRAGLASTSLSTSPARRALVPMSNGSRRSTTPSIRRAARRFYAAVRRYWPGLRDGALQPGYAGIRPKISGPTEPAADFVVQGPATHGVPGLVNLYGIESPGLTASLALADEVAKRLTES